MSLCRPDADKQSYHDIQGEKVLERKKQTIRMSGNVHTGWLCPLASCFLSSRFAESPVNLFTLGWVYV